MTARFAFRLLDRQVKSKPDKREKKDAKSQGITETEFAKERAELRTLSVAELW